MAENLKLNRNHNPITKSFMKTKFNLIAKPAAFFVALFAIAATSAVAQTNNPGARAADADRTAVAKAPDTSSPGAGTNQLAEAKLQSAAPSSAAGLTWPVAGAVRSRKLSERITVGGVVGEMIKSDHPLQLFNPFAPASYGNGEDVLTYDPHTKQATGISLFTVRF